MTVNEDKCCADCDAGIDIECNNLCIACDKYLCNEHFKPHNGESGCTDCSKKLCNSLFEGDLCFLCAAKKNLQLMKSTIETLSNSKESEVFQEERKKFSEKLKVLKDLIFEEEQINILKGLEDTEKILIEKEREISILMSIDPSFSGLQNFKNQREILYQNLCLLESQAKFKDDYKKITEKINKLKSDSN